jgi:hypothetical protein
MIVVLLSLSIMKTKNVPIVVGILTVLLPGLAAQAGPNTGLIDASGVAATSSAPISGMVGSGTTPGKIIRNRFSPEMQAKMEKVDISLDNIAGSQSFGDNYINVDPVSAEALIEVVNSPAGSNPPGLAKLGVALGGTDPAQSLAKSLLGLRDYKGNIDAAVLTNAVTAYNAYMSSLHASAIDQLPTSELDGYVRSLPEGQQAVQVLLTKLLAN